MVAFKHPFVKSIGLFLCILTASGCGLRDNVTVIIENRTQETLSNITLEVPGDEEVISTLAPSKTENISLSANEEGGLSLMLRGSRQEKKSVFYVGRHKSYICTVSIFETRTEQQCRIV